MEFGEEREEVYNALGKSEHRFEYGLRKAGTLRTCFKNSGTRDAGVRYSASIGHRWDHEKATVKHIDPTYERLNNVEAEVSKLMQEVRYHKTRATRAMHTVKSVNARVLRWSLIEAVVMVCASIYQFYHVQTLFMNRDRRGTMRV
ncbi:emp24/gp25L/p24 family/GOLD-domain-containing protein [Ostreococcus tauri]|uniref:Emp24/gp25L/p24 family/GOLD-domain-containing protein n=1 Tax=Ostreococcus tauri TaxID=70448 RepID=A0A1Y5IEU0_OSTTA|nr:emp24/gp25L/p24 family/GOLD-domain-containing protein [Ostreococcus tauri]